MAGTFHVRLVRHGETDANVRRLLESHTSTPLNDTGRRQAEALAAAWRAEGATFRRVCSSDTARALETCRLALGAAAAADDVRLEPLLRERESGALGGLTYAEASQRQAEARRSGAPIAGLETPEAAARRAAAFFDRLAAEMAAVGGEAAVFSHAGLIHLLLVHLQRRHGLRLDGLLPAGAQLHFCWNTGQTRLRVHRAADGTLDVACEFLHRDDHLTGELAPAVFLMQDGSTVQRSETDPAKRSVDNSLV